MKLIDNALSPKVADLLRQAGYDAVHVREYGLQKANDTTILERAERESRADVSADTDFGTLLGLRDKSLPSVVLLRGPTSREPTRVADRLIAEFPRVAALLDAGCIMTIEPHRARIRALPIG